MLIPQQVESSHPREGLRGPQPDLHCAHTAVSLETLKADGSSSLSVMTDTGEVRLVQSGCLTLEQHEKRLGYVMRVLAGDLYASALCVAVAASEPMPAIPDPVAFMSKRSWEILTCHWRHCLLLLACRQP